MQEVLETVHKKRNPNRNEYALLVRDMSVLVSARWDRRQLGREERCGIDEEVDVAEVWNCGHQKGDEDHGPEWRVYFFGVSLCRAKG